MAGGSGCARDVEARRQVSALRGVRGRGGCGGPASRVHVPKPCVAEGADLEGGNSEQGGPRGGRRTSVETPQAVDRLASCLFLP